MSRQKVNKESLNCFISNMITWFNVKYGTISFATKDFENKLKKAVRPYFIDKSVN